MVNRVSFNKILLITLLSLLVVFGSIFTYFTLSNRHSKVYADSAVTNFDGSPFLVNTFSSTSSDSTTWSAMTWNGLTDFSGDNIWNIGDTYYYSNYDILSNFSSQYVLDTSTNTWSAMTWNGFNNIICSNIWNIGDTYYYSRGSSSQYVLDTSTNT